MQSEIPEEIMMHAERLHDEGGYKTVPQIIAEAILAERTAYHWQPIETAPKDGSDVLLSSPNWHGDVVVGCWSFEGWRDREDSDKLEPTHWMPLPAAPAKQEE